MMLVGNPNAPEPYAERIRLPANTRLVPHSHPNEARMVTVISGTLYYAFGERFDESKLTPLPPGSFFTEPKDMPHYALTHEEVILQLNAVGPAGTRYVETGGGSTKK
jgi:quercetin dioxygenase-like cupin family protein